MRLWRLQLPPQQGTLLPTHQDAVPGACNRRTGAHAGWTSVHQGSWTPFLSSDWDNWAVLDMGGGVGALKISTS